MVRPEDGPCRRQARSPARRGSLSGLLLLEVVRARVRHHGRGRLLVGALVEAEGEREAALLLLHLQGLHRDLELEVLVHDGLQHLAQEDGEKRVVHLAEAVHGVEVREAHDLQRVVLAALRDVDLLGVAHGLQAAVELVQRADGLLALGRKPAALVAVLQHAQRGVLHHVAAREAERLVDGREEAVGHGAHHLVVHVPGLGRGRGRGQGGGGLVEGAEDGRRGEARRRDGLVLGGLGGGPPPWGAGRGGRGAARAQAREGPAWPGARAPWRRAWREERASEPGRASPLAWARPWPGAPPPSWAERASGPAWASAWGPPSWGRASSPRAWPSRRAFWEGPFLRPVSSTWRPSRRSSCRSPCSTLYISAGRDGGTTGKRLSFRVPAEARAPTPAVRRGSRSPRRTPRPPRRAPASGPRSRGRGPPTRPR